MRNLTCLALILSIQFAFAESINVLNSNFKNLTLKYGLSPSINHSYCYLKHGEVNGYRVNSLQKIASGTKALTTYFAAKTLNLHKTYRTKFYIADQMLHIEGGEDPYFNGEKMLLFFDSLRKLGFQKFKAVTFDDKFIFYHLTDRAVKVNPEVVKERLWKYFGVSNASLLSKKWASIQSEIIREGGTVPARVPIVTSLSIKHSSVNPLLHANPRVFSHESRPLYQILKMMNVESTNLIAQNIFNEASKIMSFDEVMGENQINKEEYKIYNGSGLPEMPPTGRLDNLTTCAMVVKTLSKLPEELRIHQLQVSDVLSVAGVDVGTLGHRLKAISRGMDIIMAKTGTLREVSTLSGLISGKEFLPFAILNQTTQTDNARVLQDAMVKFFMNEVEEKIPMNYSRVSLFPVPLPLETNKFLLEEVK